MNFHESNFRPESGSWGYYSLSTTPSPTKSDSCSSSWNGGPGGNSLFSSPVSTMSSPPLLRKCPSLTSAMTVGGNQASASAPNTGGARGGGGGGGGGGRESSAGGRLSRGSGLFFDENPLRRFSRFSIGSSYTDVSTVNLGDSLDFGGDDGGVAKGKSVSAGNRKAINSSTGDLNAARSASSECSPVTSGQLRPPRVRKNPFFRSLNVSCGGVSGRSGVDDILENPPDVRPKTVLSKYKALPAIGSSSKNFRQDAQMMPETIVDCDSSRGGSPDIDDDSMPFPADISNFGEDDYYGGPTSPRLRTGGRRDGDGDGGEAFLLHVASNLTPDDVALAAPDKPVLARRRTFEIIEPVDDDLERPVVDDCAVYSESEDDDDDDDDNYGDGGDDVLRRAAGVDDDEDDEDCQIRVDVDEVELRRDVVDYSPFELGQQGPPEVRIAGAKGEKNPPTPEIAPETTDIRFPTHSAETTVPEPFDANGFENKTDGC